MQFPQSGNKKQPLDTTYAHYNENYLRSGVQAVQELLDNQINIS